MSLRKKKYDIKITNTGVLQLYGENRVYLLPQNYAAIDSLNKNYLNWLVLSQSEYKKLFSYRLKKHNYFGECFYSINKLAKKNIKLEDALYINSFCGKKSVQNSFQNVTTEISLGVQLFKELVKVNTLPKVLQVKDTQGVIGLLHGDFHSDNILIDRSGNCCLIDLDRVKIGGPIIFNIIHFICVENEKAGVRWLDEIYRFINCEPNSLSSFKTEEIINYMFYRFSFELFSNADNLLYTNKVISFYRNVVRNEKKEYSS
jgi:serine/threonine protein kinase